MWGRKPQQVIETSAPKLLPNDIYGSLRKFVALNKTRLPS